MKKEKIIVGIMFVLFSLMFCGCDEPVDNQPENYDIYPQMNQSFIINSSVPYRFWKLNLSEDAPIRIQASLDELENGVTPKVDFIFFDGSTNDEFSALSKFNASSIDKTWTIPYDGIFFFGVECKYGFKNFTGTIVISY